MKTEYINLQRESDGDNALGFSGTFTNKKLPDTQYEKSMQDKITFLESLLSQKEQEIKEKDDKIEWFKNMKDNYAKMVENLQSTIKQKDEELAALKRKTKGLEMSCAMRGENMEKYCKRLGQQLRLIKEKDARIAELENGEAYKGYGLMVLELQEKISALQKENEAYRAAIKTVMEMKKDTKQYEIATHLEVSLPFLNNPDK